MQPKELAMFKNILVGYDGSEPADKAFAIGIELARMFHGRIRVVAVARPPEPAADVETEAALEAAQEHFEERFAELSQRAAAAGVEAAFTVLVGHPADQLLLEAERHGIDHIVVGHRGRNFMQRWLMGSVARHVMDHAACPITVAR
jgi:nucleotide-binding universal stress UspA family protein